VNINWPNDLRVGCKSLSNLIEFIGIDAKLKKYLQYFERVFERDEVVNIKKKPLLKK
jgi:hypothetical protein